jgi:hypothetical protein
MYRKKLISALVFILLTVGSILSQTPEIPVITNVSVDKITQKVSVNWRMNNPAIVDGYIVFRQIFGQVGVVNGTFNQIDTIYNKNQFSYLDISIVRGPANPAAGIENYRVASFRLVGGIFEYSNMSNPVSTFHLLPIDFNLCLEQNSLTWTSYHGLGANLSGYRIYYSNTQFGTLVFLNEQPASDTTYTHHQVAANTPYFYYVVAFSKTQTDSSFSNIQQITTTMPAVPLIMQANYGTVEKYNQVDLSFTLDANAAVKSYLLLKSDAKDGKYDTIASFPKGSAIITYSDFVKTNQEVAYYKVVAINSCGLKSRESNIAHNIVLEAAPNQQIKHSNILKWNLYEGWPGNVLNYAIFRSVDENAFEEVATVGPNVNTYVDDISQWLAPEINGQASKGHFCYYVVAHEAAGNQNQSKSNISCAQQETISFIPNAFNPNSPTDVNRTFKPVISFVNDYTLIVYNRSGEIIFQSKDPLLGWDGKNRGGELMKRGTYVYYLKYRAKDNKLVEKSGQINLVY